LSLIFSLLFVFIRVHSWFKFSGSVRERTVSEDEAGLLMGEEVHRVVGCAMEVSNVLGHGLLEKPYENALVVEFGLRGIPYQQQPRFDVVYKTIKIGEYVPDLICFDQIVVDTKTIECIGNNEIGQMLNYLKITGLRVGILLNFKHPRLEWKRVVY